MQDPITTLIQLNELTLELDEVQSWIDHVRSVVKTNQVVQLKLDRHQTDVNARRLLIEQVKFSIASRN